MSCPILTLSSRPVQTLKRRQSPCNSGRTTAPTSLHLSDLSPASTHRHSEPIASMPPPKLSEKITLHDLFPNVDFDFIPDHSALDEPSLSNNDDYNEYFPQPVFDTTLSIPYCIQHTSVSYHIPNPAAFIEPVYFNVNDHFNFNVNNHFNFSITPTTPPEAPAAQPNVCTNGEPRLDICSTGKFRPKTRAVEARIVALSWNVPKSDIYWIWLSLGFTWNHLLVKLCAYYLNIT